MRPLRLRVKGFAAFRDDTEVDFSDVELAALVGPTGSGKSTVIDGITFALFGAVARYDDNRAVAPVINQLSTEARAELEFEVDGERYTAVWVVRRTDVGATTKEARLERGVEILASRASEMGEAVEKALGLDFDRFTKTVVLPQGRFARFLHDQPRDRQEVLRQLLGLDLYTRMGAEARKRAATCRDQREVLEPRLQAGAPSEEEVARLAAVVESARQAQAELKELTDGLAGVGKDLVEAQSETERLGRMLPTVAEIQVPDEAKTLDAELKSTTEADRAAAEKANEARGRARQAERDAAEGPNAEACRRLIGEYERLAGQREELTRLEASVKEADRSHAEAKEQAEAVRGRLAEAENETRTARQSAEVAAAAAVDGPDKAELQRIRDQRAELGRLTGELDDLVAKRSEAETAEAEARALCDQARAAFDEATGSLNRARTVKQAEGLVDQLVEGEPCPVCRQPVLALPDHDLDAELEALKSAEAAAAAGLRERESALTEATTARAAVTAETNSASRRRGELADGLTGAPDEDEVERLTAEADRLAAATAEADERLKATTTAEEELRQADETKRVLKGEHQAEIARTEVMAKRNACRDQCDELAGRLAKEPEVPALEADLARAEALDAARREAQVAEQSAADQAQTAREALERTRATEAEARRRYGVARDGLAALSLSPPAAAASLLEDWEALAYWAATKATELEKEKKAVESRGRSLEARQAELTGQAREVCAPHFDPPSDPRDFAAEMATAVARAESAHQQAVRQRKEMANLEKQIEELRTAEAVAAELGRLLRSDGFERWLMEEAVGDLKERASERLLELSNRQYSFAPDGTDFDVCDHHSADEVRGAKTLSGGETFLASLALALALTDGQAEMAPEGSPGLDSLFLDEGFGALDPDTLDVVAAAIEELGATGRMVVIVTHIRELADRMPVRFEVAKDPTTSSVERVEV